MPRKWYDAKVTKILSENKDVRRFFLQILSEEPFIFLPGQFVTFDLPVGEKRLDRWRSYSIASAPSDDNTIELCIVHLDDGKGSSYFFNDVSVGSILQLKGPEGSFVLPDISDHDLILVCTGTGIAPFRSMIQYALREKLPYRFHLIFGCRKQEDILYFEEMSEIARSEPTFLKYDVCLSREIIEEFHHGYVHKVYQEKYETHDDGITFMLCGWSRMIDEARENLIEKMGFSQQQVKYELYG